MDLSLIDLWHQMGLFAKFICFVMAVMSIYSLTVMVSKWWGLRKAQKETIKFAPEFSQFLEEDNLTEAIRLAESYKRSHVALVLGGARGRAQHAARDNEPEARSRGARDGRRNGAVRRSSRNDDGHRERVHRNGRDWIGRSRRNRRWYR